jgi:N-acyl-D-amino-acid deacylase
MLDLLVSGGLVADGSGTRMFHGDIGVIDGEIVAVGGALAVESARRIDATSLVVTPGFVDPCPCGFENRRHLSNRYLSQGVTSAVELFESTADLRHRAALETGLDIAPMLDYSRLRKKLGRHFSRPLDAAEWLTMKTEIESSLDQGARGVTVTFASANVWLEEEMCSIARILARRGMRLSIGFEGPGEFERLMADWTGKLAELAHVAGAVHLHSIFSSGSTEKMDDILEKIDTMQDAGLSITLDRVPYTGSVATLLAFLADERSPRLSARVLADPLIRAKVRRLVKQRLEALDRNTDNLVVTSASKPAIDFEPYLGRRLAELAGLGRRGDPFDGVVEALRIQEMEVGLVHFPILEEDLLKLVSRRYAFIAASEFRPSSILTFPDHPSHAGACPSAIRRFALENRSIELERLVRRLSKDVAELFGLPDVGQIRKGKQADLVVLDLKAIASSADFLNPSSPPAGIRYVIKRGAVISGLHQRLDN